MCVFWYLDLATLSDLVLLRNSVGHYHRLEVGAVYARDRRSGEDPVCQNGVDFSRAGRDQPNTQHTHTFVLQSLSMRGPLKFLLIKLN